MTRLKRFFAGVWEFIVGDDWRSALGVLLALAFTALLADAAISAWWVMPLAVIGLLAFSIRRAAVETRGRMAQEEPREARGDSRGRL